MTQLADKNISQSDLADIKILAVLPAKSLREIANLTNINTNLCKSDIIYALIRSEPIINEQRYLFDSDDEIKDKVKGVD